MIVGARYKAIDGNDQNSFGWDYAVVLKVGKKRKRPSGGYPIQNCSVYFYNKEEKPNSFRCSIVEIGCEEFHEDFEMSYNLTGIDGIKEIYS